MAKRHPREVKRDTAPGREAPDPVSSPAETPFSTTDPAVVQRLSAQKIYPSHGTGSPMVHTYRLEDADRIREILGA